MKRVWITVAAIMLLGGTAWAVPVSLSGSQLSTFTQLSDPTDSTTVLFDYGTDYAAYQTTWYASIEAPGEAVVGNTFSGMGWSSSDTLSLGLWNDNENEWQFTLVVSDGTTENVSSSVWLSPDAFNILSVSLAGLDTSADLEISLRIVSTNPWSPRTSGPGLDRVAEYRITTVPEPATMILMGSGLLGLAGFARRKKKI